MENYNKLPQKRQIQHVFRDMQYVLQNEEGRWVKARFQLLKKILLVDWDCSWLT